ncbi:MAG: nucleotidyltransferase family protein [Draconibacterium sp.]
MKGNPVMIFVGKCLTLGKYPERKNEIITEIQATNFSWENAVLNASNQFVLPAWYIQLKNAGLLDEMPEELKLHIESLTNLNRERNYRIINQAKEIAVLLNQHGITPVFLKGTAHLLLNLYNDPAERMIGDIDFLVRDHEILPAAKLLKTLGFQPLVEYNSAMHSEMKHYPRMVNYDYPAAVEIHREVTNPPNDRYFRAGLIFSEIQKIKGTLEIYVPGYRHLLIHNMLNAQLNDKSFSNAGILLRQSYDLFLLAGKENPLTVFDEFGKLRNTSGAWLASSSLLLGNPPNLQFGKTKSVKSYLHWFIYLQQHPRVAGFYRTTLYFSWRLWRYISLPVRAIFNPSIRAGIMARLTDKSWYGKHINSYRKHFKTNL